MTLRAGNVKLVEENKGKNSGDLGMNKDYLSTAIIFFFNWTLSKLEAFSLQETLLTIEKCHILGKMFAK